MTNEPVTDEFFGGIWWVPAGDVEYRWRNATPGECAAEIQRLRGLLSRYEWQPISEMPDDGKFLVAQYAPTSWQYLVTTIAMYPDMPKSLRTNRLKYAKAWMPIMSEPTIKVMECDC